jgi:hypothetical protein
MYNTNTTNSNSNFDNEKSDESGTLRQVQNKEEIKIDVGSF